MQFFKRCLFKFSDLSSRRPLTVAICSTSTLCFLGDVLCQQIERKFEIDCQPQEQAYDQNLKQWKWNYTRSLKFGCVGIPMGIFLSVWYRVLCNVIFPGKSFQIALKRVLLDQTLFAPSIISYVFIATTIADGGSLNDCWLRIRMELFPTLMVNWSIWPFVQLFNLWMVPIEYRVLVANFVCIWWNTYLSFKSFKQLPTTKEGEITNISA